MSSPGATRATRAGTGAVVCDASVAIWPPTTGSTLRSVTGRSGIALPGSTRSRMPKSAGNFASGGFSSVRTVSGNDDALLNGRPASSLRPAGNSSRNFCRSGNPGPKVTRSAMPASSEAMIMAG